jgi:thiosulfate/3-mercaptopyruvate sulfurtransferase
MALVWRTLSAAQGSGPHRDAQLMPDYHTLISVAELQAALAQEAVRLLDCRFDLARPDSGRSEFASDHIPSAHYAHLDEDLSGPPRAGFGGRHPLPDAAHWQARVARWGIHPGDQVVAYDSSGGCFAARAWLLFRLYGHARVAVLDGGWQHWQQSQAGASAEVAAPAALTTEAGPAAVRAWAGIPPDAVLVDARDPERYRGEFEPIDPRAGHIPGAINRPWKRNLAPDGRFLPAAELRQSWLDLLQGVQASAVVCYCGSGVTACHNLLALSHAGLPGATLYPGSWSEYCADPARPVAVDV